MDSNSSSVYLGNIPFDYTEEQVLEIAKSVGPVIDLKLFFDNITGKSKGYAFVRYGDHETAESAVRNLNNFSIGNRNLKCTFSSDNNTSFLHNDNPGNGASKLPPLPLGVQIYPNETAPQVVSNVLSALDSSSASEIVKEAKKMSLEDPNLTKVLLERYPQLSHALVETILLLNLTSRDTIELVLNKRTPELNRLTKDHVRLLNEIEVLSSSEIELLDEDKQKIIGRVQEEIKKGSYGTVL